MNAMWIIRHMANIKRRRVPVMIGRRKKLATIAILFIHAVLISGCNGESPSPPDYPTFYTSVRSSVITVPGGDSFYLHHTDDDIYTFFSWYPIDGLRKGSILAGRENGGYMREAISFERDGYFTSIHTVPCPLTGALRSGLVESTFHAGPGPFPGGTDLSGAVLYSSDEPDRQGSITISNGVVNFSPVTSFRLAIAHSSVWELDLSVEGSIYVECDIEADIENNFSHSGETEIMSFTEEETVWLNGLPVVIDMRFALAIRISAEGTSCDSCTYGVTCSGAIFAGTSWKDGAWKDIDENILSFTATPLTCNGYMDGDIEILIVPEVTISLCGEILLDLETAPGTLLRSEVFTLPAWRWEQSGLNCLDIRYHEGVAGYAVPPLHGEGYCGETFLAGGPFQTDDFIFMMSWGEEGTGEYGFGNPSGAAVTHNGRIAVSDRFNSRLSIFAPDSTFITSWGNQGSGAGEFLLPCGIAAGPGGDIFAVDNGNRRIQRFTSTGGFILMWGNRGDGDGEFREPEDVCVAPDGTILVVDSYSDRVQRFKDDGTFVESWGSHGSGPGEFNGALGITCDADGNIYVTECYNHRVQKFSPDGVFMTMWGLQGLSNGEFNCPTGIEVGPDGNIYIADYGNNRVQIFASDGSFFSSLGTSGTGDGEFNNPRDLAVSGTGELFVIDSGNFRIQAFAPIP